MENFQFWLTFATATIPAAMTGLLSFWASWLKSRSDLKSLREKFKHDMETLEKNHTNELEKMKEAHKLELENIQKQSESDMSKELLTMVMNVATPALKDVFNEEVKKQFKQNRKSPKK